MKRLYLVLVAVILVGCEGKAKGAGVATETSRTTQTFVGRTAEAQRAKSYRKKLPNWNQAMKPAQMVLDIVVVPGE
jgi:hypothetical protein